MAEAIHEIIPVGMLACNCHIIGDPVTREALVIDPGDETARILEALMRHALKVRAIVSTHAHIDHVGGLRHLQQATGAPVLMHGDDLELYQHLKEQAAFLGVPVPDAAQVDQLLREGDTLRWGPFEAQVFHTPGHTRGSVSLYLPAVNRSPAPDQAPVSSPILVGLPAVAGEADLPTAAGEPAGKRASSGQLFAGDTLFAGSIGRTDLWGGSLPTILRSIREKLLILPEDTVVYPGHGIATTIGQERETNPFLS